MVEQSVSVGKSIKTKAWHPERPCEDQALQGFLKFWSRREDVWRCRMLIAGIALIPSKFLEDFPELNQKGTRLMTRTLGL